MQFCQQNFNLVFHKFQLLNFSVLHPSLYQECVRLLIVEEYNGHLITVPGPHVTVHKGLQVKLVGIVMVLADSFLAQSLIELIVLKLGSRILRTR